MKPNPILILVALVAGGWLFVQMVVAAIAIVGIGLGASPGVAVIAGFLIAVGLAIHAIVKSNKVP